jgi:hypothetical protein
MSDDGHLDRVESDGRSIVLHLDGTEPVRLDVRRAKGLVEALETVIAHIQARTWVM